MGNVLEKLGFQVSMKGDLLEADSVTYFDELIIETNGQKRIIEF